MILLAKEAQEKSSASRLHVHVDGAAPLRGEVFVFGSNLAGRHGAGAALAARQRFGAVLGLGVGYQGLAPAHSYAIPTKDQGLSVLPLASIERYVAEFGDFVRSHPGLAFFVTRVGCGLAGYANRQVAPLFARHVPLERCSWPEEWRPYLA